MPLRLPTRPSARPHHSQQIPGYPFLSTPGWSGIDGQLLNRMHASEMEEGCSSHTHDPLVALLGDERAVRLNAWY